MDSLVRALSNVLAIPVDHYRFITTLIACTKLLACPRSVEFVGSAVIRIFLLGSRITLTGLKKMRFHMDEQQMIGISKRFKL